MTWVSLSSLKALGVVLIAPQKLLAGKNMQFRGSVISRPCHFYLLSIMYYLFGFVVGVFLFPLCVLMTF